MYDCSAPQLQRCKLQIEQQLLDTSTYKSKLTENESCDLTRASFDCLVWYSTHCLDSRGRSLVGPLISSARQHLVRRCEWEDQVHEGWSDKSCFRNEQVMRCNDDYSSKKYGYGSECLRYNDYDNCIQNVIKDRGCESKFLTSYLYDRGSSSAWMCQARDFRGVTPISASFVTELTESMSCVSKISDQIQGCSSDHWRSSTAVVDVVQNGCCAYYSKLDCVKRAALAYCDGQAYLHVMKAMVSQTIPCIHVNYQ